ncbi:MAG: SUMF1/EgtB/PvdO family nonheme iron enzyme [Phycisphaerae bacterium]|nr:SUMF1/EgtB/PvdO family nonheme iron enzyme [Phycisphaerae bacterium]
MWSRKIMAVLALVAGFALVAGAASVRAGDVDGDGVDDALDVCNNTPAGTAVDAEGRPLGDVDQDCDTDLDDYALFQQGFTGPLAAPDCNENGVPDDLDIALGTSEDCQPNNIPDECDIAAGTSNDCNNNGVPDECELQDNDCNANGVPDECDLPGGHNCCEWGNGVGCSNPAIQDCVCDIDPYCCEVEWDRTCVLEVTIEGCWNCRDGNDCNTNAVPDECDIAAGTSADLNANGIPDECEGLLEGMVLIPGGEFEMGNHYGVGDPDELPVHAVRVDPFYMDVYEVTNQQYCDYLNSAYAQGSIQVTGGVVHKIHDESKPYCDTYEASSYSRIHFSGGTFTITTGKEDHPMVEVSWYGAAAYCNWRSDMHGREACYDLSTWACDFSKNGYRLPTEAEWEYAARGGHHSPHYKYPWGNDIDGSKANYWPSGDPYETGGYPWTTPVGYYDGGQTPSGSDMVNGYGLYDMAGNVYEWCNDWYDSAYYSISPYDSPQGPASGTYRVLRGGSWYFNAYGLRCANRYWNMPDYPNNPNGFRVAAASNPVPRILAIPGTTVCEGTTVMLDAGADFSSYLWALGGQTTQTITVTATGTYSVTVTNAQGCTGSDSIDITVNPNPTPGISATPDATVCEGTIVTLDAGAGYSSYSWSTGATTQTINVTTSAIYSVIVENADGCTGSDSINVTVNPNPTPTITASPGVTVCDGTTVTLDAGAGHSNYLWSTGETTRTIEVTTTGTYSVTVTDAGGCEGNDSIDISVNPNPDASITAAASVYEGSIGNTASVSNAGPGASYDWSITTNGTITAGLGTQQITYTAGNGPLIPIEVVVTTWDGCVSTDTFVVTVDPSPPVTITADDEVCEGSTGNSASVPNQGPGASYVWTVSGGTITVGQGTPVITYTAGAGPMVVIDVEITTGGGVTLLGNKLVTVNPNPAPTITAAPGNVVCDGMTVTLDAGAGFSSYLWQPGGQTTRTINVTTGATYSVTVIDANGCEGGDSIDITVNPNPTPAITASPGVTVCDGTIVTLDVGAYADYLWSTGETTQTIDVITTGTYSVTVTNAGGCTGNDSIDISVNPNLIPTITATPGAEVCDGTTVTLDAGPFSTYLWAPGGQTTRTISVTTAGTYSVTVTDATGCDGSDSIDITVNANPVPSISANPGTEVCDGETVTLDAGAGFSSCLWSPGGQTTQTIDVTAGGTYSVTVANASGCEGSDDINITVNANPAPDILAIPGPVVCEGMTVTLDAGSGFSSYLWAPGGQTTRTIDVTATGTYSVTVTNASGCSGSDSIDIAANPNLTPTITAAPGEVVCDGERVTLDAGVGFSTYLWSPGGQTTQTIQVTTGGTYSVTVTDYGCGCDGSDSITITVTPTPAAGITAAPSVCPGSAGNNASVANAGPGAGYAWSITGGTITDGDDGTSPSIIYTADMGASLTIEVTVTNSHGCPADGDVVVPIRPAVEITATPGTEVCDGETVTLDAGAYSSYLWSTGETTQTIDVTVSGNYSVTATDAIGCQGTDDIDITVHVNPTPTITATPSTDVCDGETVMLDVWGYAGYLWSTGATTPIIEVTVSGNYSVTVTDANGCQGTDDIDITVHDNPDCTITAPFSALAGSSGNAASVPVDLDPAAVYRWSIAPGDGTIDTGYGTDAITFTVAAPIGDFVDITVEIIDSDGCTCTDTVSIPVI